MRHPVRYAASGAVRVAYQVTGTGPIDLVWAPGTISHLDLDWEQPAKAQFIEALSSFTRLIRFDKRGTGLSDRPTDAATLEERTDDIRAVMDAAGSSRAAIFGMSEGASMACLFAATYPGAHPLPPDLGRPGPLGTNGRLPVGADRRGVAGDGRRGGRELALAGLPPRARARASARTRTRPCSTGRSATARRGRARPPSLPWSG